MATEVQVSQKRKPGRPPLPDHERKRSNLTFRARAGLRERIATEAAKSGRSMSEEIEWRIGMSFEWERAFGDVQTMIKRTRRPA